MERYRIVESHALYFLTFSIVQWLPVFISEDRRQRRGRRPTPNK